MTNFIFCFGILLINILGSTFRLNIRAKTEMLYVIPFSFLLQLEGDKSGDVVVKLSHNFVIAVHDKNSTRTWQTEQIWGN